MGIADSNSPGNQASTNYFASKDVIIASNTSEFPRCPLT